MTPLYLLQIHSKHYLLTPEEIGQLEKRVLEYPVDYRSSQAVEEETENLIALKVLRTLPQLTVEWVEEKLQVAFRSPHPQ